MGQNYEVVLVQGVTEVVWAERVSTQTEGVVTFHELEGRRDEWRSYSLVNVIRWGPQR